MNAGLAALSASALSSALSTPSLGSPAALAKARVKADWFAPFRANARRAAGVVATVGAGEGKADKPVVVYLDRNRSVRSPLPSSSPLSLVPT